MVGEFEEVSGSFAVGVFVAVCFVDDDEVGLPVCEGLGDGGGVSGAEEAVCEDEYSFFWVGGFFVVLGCDGLGGVGVVVVGVYLGACGFVLPVGGEAGWADDERVGGVGD